MIITVAYPQSWLSWTISVINMTTEVEDFSGAMVEVGTTKLYKYEFTEVAWESYVFTITMPWYDDYVDSVIYEASSWLTPEQNTKLFSLENSTGGGGFSSQAIQTSISNAKQAIIEKIEEIKPTDLTGIETQLNEIDSHITLAKDDTIDTIKESEIEVCSDIMRTKTEIKKDNVATRQLVRQKTKNLAEIAQKQLDSEAKTQKMIESEADELEQELEKIYEKEADNLEEELQSIYEKEYDQIEQETNQSNNGNN